MNRSRWSDVGAILAAVAVVSGLVFALRPHQTPTLAVSPIPAQSARPQPADAHPTALFIGDSYTAGNGFTEMSPNCVAATKMGWLCKLSAVPGTGYISGGPANRFVVDPYVGVSTSFSERIPGLAAVFQPDFVILDGGRNDQFPPKHDVFDAMAATIAETRRAWPTATLIFIRPRFLAHPADDLGFDDAFINRLRAQPGAEEMDIIDPIVRFTREDTSGMLADDQTHPNQRGEQELAQALVESLSGHGFAGKT